MNLMNTTMLIAGVILIWAAIKDENPVDVIKNTLAGKATVGGGVQPMPTPTPTQPNPNLRGRGTNPTGGTAV